MEVRMSLREELNSAIAALDASYEPKAQLDAAGRYAVLLPLPSAVIELREGRLPIEVALSKTGNYFSLLSPLAVIDDQATRGFCEALLHRQFYADQVAGISFAINVLNDDDILMAVYHWMLPSISADQFAALFKRFVTAVIEAIGELNTMARQSPGVTPFHEGPLT
jgi:hypothetical protein